jgi:hypothetical protein
MSCALSATVACASRARAPSASIRVDTLSCAGPAPRAVEGDARSVARRLSRNRPLSSKDGGRTSSSSQFIYVFVNCVYCRRLCGALALSFSLCLRLCGIPSVCVGVCSIVCPLDRPFLLAVCSPSRWFARVHPHSLCFLFQCARNRIRFVWHDKRPPPTSQQRPTHERSTSPRLLSLF